MSIIPQQGEPLDLFKGHTFDETWEFFEDDETTLMDLTGWGAELKVRAAFDSAAALTIASGALVVGPTANAMVMGGAAGTIRIYVGSTVMAALTAANFTEVSEDDGTKTYRGVWDLELIRPVTLERFRYAMGPATFSLEATY